MGAVDCDQSILGVRELARLAGVSDPTMRGYVSRGQCPAPDWRLACGPVWRRDTVAAWIADRDRRVEKVRAATGRVIERGIKDAADYVYGSFANSKEQAVRAHHNRMVNRGIARSKDLSYARRFAGKSTGIVPTQRAEARGIAEHLVWDGKGDVPQDVLSRNAWADRILDRRATWRSGSPDGIPF